MADSWTHIILMLIGLAGWVLTATPLLAHMVFLAEKDFRWPLLGWFTVITICIFLLKFSLFSFFYPLWLFASPLVPYLREIRRSRSFFNRRDAKK